MASNASHLSTKVGVKSDSAQGLAAKSGVKGSDVYDGTGDPRVDLSVMAVRGVSIETIKPLMEEILARGALDQQMYEDAFVLAFQTRNIRGGKGERTASSMMFGYLLKYTPEMVKILDLVPHFGCWRDLFEFASNILEKESPWCIATKEAVIRIAKAQLIADVITPDDKPISLCAKWAPRESKGCELDQALAKELANAMFPHITKFSQRLRAYRKMLSKLNVRVKTVEVNMCGGDWTSIEPARVPGRALDKYRAAFLNEAAGTKKGQRVQKHVLRRPNDEDRMECRDHFRAHFAAAAAGEVVVKGSDTLYPHEVIKKILESFRYDQYYGEKADISDGERDLILGQWRAFVEKARLGGALSNCVAMCDFSGSMDGVPKMVSLALGLLIAEVSGTNKFLTFDTDPKWHQMSREDNILERVGKIGDIGQGLSTDFQKAMDLVLADVKARRLRPDQLPKDLIVFTDMGFDKACGSDAGMYRHIVKTAPWQTHIQMIREAWRRAGEDMWNQPFEAPRIVIWNLRAEYKDFHATSDQEGVIMLSGWSPALFKVIQETRVEVLSPMAALRLQLDDPMYNVVRERLRALNA